MTSFVITQLSLCGFRSFATEHSWTLGQLTKITGHNYQGKFVNCRCHCICADRRSVFRRA